MHNQALPLNHSRYHHHISILLSREKLWSCDILESLESHSQAVNYFFFHPKKERDGIRNSFVSFLSWFGGGQWDNTTVCTMVQQVNSSSNERHPVLFSSSLSQNLKLNRNKKTSKRFLVLIWNFEWLRMCYAIIFLNRSRLIFVEYYNKHIWASPGTFI